MTKEIFISYSRRDQEFVSRLASDLNAHVAGVWFDQSDIQLGEKWHDEIIEGIRDCKAFILVLSPDSTKSKYVQDEVDKALELGKTIFPVIYRPSKWTGEFETLIKEVQTLDLRSSSYTESFRKLVDGLIEAGAGKVTTERPFIRQAINTPLNIVLSKIPGWAFAWGLGWMVFWLIVFIFFFTVIALQGNAGPEDFLNFLVILFGAATGGFAGGLLAGLFTMLALRPNAPSISWKHMSPTIRIWGISGPLGMIASGLITVAMLAIGVIAAQSAIPNCSGIGLGDCINQVSREEYRGVFVFILLVFLLFGIVSWLITGMFAGWQAVRHIRRLEPGITNRQGWSVSLGWGCGAVAAAFAMIFVVGLLSNLFGL